jgi:CheY-like chemotaxis protein
MPRVLNNRNQQARILVLEDDSLQLQILEAVLLSEGFEVDGVTSGLDAVREIRPGRYDVVLVDYDVPEINGLAVAKLTGDFLSQAVRPGLIAITASPVQLNARESGSKSAFDAIIAKSSDFSSLLSAIGQCLLSAPDSVTMQQAGAAQLYKDWENYDAEPARPGAQGDDPGPPRILVAEDDDLQRMLLTSVLEHRGYVVEAVSNGLEAIRRIREGCFDLALVDYNLPEMDGLATGTLVLDLMQEHLRPRLIALTATPARLNDKEMLPGSVFDQVLGKSSDLHGLMQVVDRHLRTSPNPAARRAAALTLPVQEVP